MLEKESIKLINIERSYYAQICKIAQLLDPLCTNYFLAEPFTDMKTGLQQLVCKHTDVVDSILAFADNFRLQSDFSSMKRAVKLND